MNNVDRLLIEQLKVVADHCVETGLKAGAGAVENAIGELARLRAELDTLTEQHGLLLTRIREGQPLPSL